MEFIQAAWFNLDPQYFDLKTGFQYVEMYYYEVLVVANNVYLLNKLIMPLREHS